VRALSEILGLDDVVAGEVASGVADTGSVAGTGSLVLPADVSCAAEPTSLACQLTEYLAILVPALVTTLLTIQSYLDPDSQVITLKSGAARIEMEIYCFRTRTGPYGRAAAASPDDEDDGGGGAAMPARERFGQKITTIWDGILKSSVSEHSMPRRIPGYDHRAVLRKEYAATQDMVAKYMPGEMGGSGDDDDDGGGKPALHGGDKRAAKKAAKKAVKAKRVAPGPEDDDDDEEEAEAEGEVVALDDSGFGPMSAEEYVKFRMLPKLIAYSRLSPVQAQRKTAFKMLAIGLSACTTLLGALDRAVPVPLIVQLASALAGWEAYRQMSISLKLTNSALGQLERLVLWWQSLSMIEKRRPDRKERLVKTTEDVISSAVPELAIAKQMEANEDDGEGDKKGG